jgi:hypothetical protein
MPSLTSLAACLYLLFPGTAHAATTYGDTRAVLNCNDSGAGSLRQAVLTAPSGSLIDLTGLTCRRIDLTSGAIKVGQDDLTLKGRSISSITIDGGLTSSLFRHSGSGRLTLDGLTVQRGFHHAAGEAFGGCVYSKGAVELRHARVRWCRALSEGGQSQGGAVYAEGPLRVVYSQVLGNTAFHAAGLRTLDRLRVHHSRICSNHSPRGQGAAALADKGMNITNATFSENTGGAIRAFAGATVIASSTISGNQGAMPALWIGPDNDGAGTSAELINTTVSGNRSGRGVVRFTGVANSIVNSTIAFNDMYEFTTGAGCAPSAIEVVDPKSPLHLDSSIIGNNTCNGEPYTDLWIFWPDTPNVVGANNLVMRSYGIELPSDTLHADPRLEPLAENGGPTRTHALSPYSPAVDSGNNAAGLSYDQRGSGFPRVQGEQADMGAYER